MHRVCSCVCCRSIIIIISLYPLDYAILHMAQKSSPSAWWKEQIVYCRSLVLHVHQSSVIPAHILLGRRFSFVTYLPFSRPSLSATQNRSRKKGISSHDFPMPPPDCRLPPILIIDYRTHYRMLCISPRVIFRKPFSLPLQKFLNKFNCLHPPSEMTLCVLLHN